MERTLSIIKPDAVKKATFGKIMDHFEEKGLRIVALRMVHLGKSQAQDFYAVHKERGFYQDLVSFMTMGPILVMVLEGENAIARNREVMGATNPEEAKEGTLRKLYGTDVEKNAVHGSDSPETAKKEIEFFFNDSQSHQRI